MYMFPGGGRTLCSNAPRGKDVVKMSPCYSLTIGDRCTHLCGRLVSWDVRALMCAVRWSAMGGEEKWDWSDMSCGRVAQSQLSKVCDECLW